MSVVLNESFARGRMFWSRLAGIAILLLMLFWVPPPQGSAGVRVLLEVIGFLLLSTATIVRLWSTTYIAGLKNQVLMREGPYSVVRNPLYVASFLGGLGFGLITQNLYVTLAIVGVFILYYPFVVRYEERRLEGKFGESFRAYLREVPRWFPKFSLYHEPETYVVQTRRLRRGYFNAMWFVWVFLLWKVIEKLHALGIVPVLLQ